MAFLAVAVFVFNSNNSWILPSLTQHLMQSSNKKITAHDLMCLGGSYSPFFNYKSITISVFIHPIFDLIKVDFKLFCMHENLNHLKSTEKRDENVCDGCQFYLPTIIWNA